MKKNFVLFLAILLVSVSACKNPFFKNMLDKNSGNASSVPEKPQLPNPQEPAVPENPANPDVPEPQLPKYTVTFGVDGQTAHLKLQLTAAKSIRAIKSKRASLLSLPQSRMQAMR